MQLLIIHLTILVSKRGSCSGWWIQLVKIRWITALSSTSSLRWWATRSEKIPRGRNLWKHSGEIRLKTDIVEATLVKTLRTFDANNDGYIDVTDLKRILTTLGDEKLTRRDIELLVEEADADNDGFVNYEGEVIVLSIFWCTKELNFRFLLHLVSRQLKKARWKRLQHLRNCCLFKTMIYISIWEFSHQNNCIWE